MEKTHWDKIPHDVGTIFIARGINDFKAFTSLRIKFRGQVNGFVGKAKGIQQ